MEVLLSTLPYLAAKRILFYLDFDDLTNLRRSCKTLRNFAESVVGSNARMKSGLSGCWLLRNKVALDVAENPVICSRCRESRPVLIGDIAYVDQNISGLNCLDIMGTFDNYDFYPLTEEIRFFLSRVTPKHVAFVSHRLFIAYSKSKVFDDGDEDHTKPFLRNIIRKKRKLSNKNEYGILVYGLKLDNNDKKLKLSGLHR